MRFSRSLQCRRFIRASKRYKLAIFCATSHVWFKVRVDDGGERGEGQGPTPPVILLLIIVHYLGTNFYLSSAVRCRKIKVGSSNFTKGILNTRSPKYVCSANYFSRDPATRGYFIVHRARNDGKIIFKFLTVEDERWFIHGHKKITLWLQCIRLIFLLGQFLKFLLLLLSASFCLLLLS